MKKVVWLHETSHFMEWALLEWWVLHKWNNYVHYWKVPFVSIVYHHKHVYILFVCLEQSSSDLLLITSLREIIIGL